MRNFNIQEINNKLAHKEGINMNDNEVKKIDRFVFLSSLFKMSKGVEYNYIKINDIISDAGLDEVSASKIAESLFREGLIVYNLKSGSMGITNYGIREIIMTFTDPEKPSNYFPPLEHIKCHQILKIDTDIIGDDNIDFLDNDQYLSLKKIVKKLVFVNDKCILSNREKNDLIAQIKTIEAQLTSSQPNATILKLSLNSAIDIIEVSANKVTMLQTV